MHPTRSCTRKFSRASVIVLMANHQIRAYSSVLTAHHSVDKKSIDIPSIAQRKHQSHQIDNASSPLQLEKQENACAIQDDIKHCKHPTEIVSLLEQHQHNIGDAYVYLEAMRKCFKLDRHDVRPIHKTFVLLLESGIALKTRYFNKFFDCVHDSPLLCARYFKAMTTKYALTPDAFTFSILIKGCISQARYRTGGKYWYLMKLEYGMKPNDVIYKEMLLLYASANKCERAQKIFDEYMEKVERDELKVVDRSTMRAYLNVFTANGNIKGMQQALQRMRHFDIDLSAEIIADVMHGYVNAKRADKALAIFDSYVEKIDPSKHGVLLHEKCVALSQMIAIGSHRTSVQQQQQQQQSLFLELQQLIYEEFPARKIKLWKSDAHALLQAAINVYGGRDPKEITAVFEQLVNDKHIRYLRACDDGAIGFDVDLHGFTKQTAKFVLSYVIGTKLHELMGEGKETLCFIVGQGLHTYGAAKKNGTMGEFVRQELLKFEPSIQCEPDVENKGRCVIHRSQLMPYLNNSNSFAFSKLSQSST